MTAIDQNVAPTLSNSFFGASLADTDPEISN